MIPEAAVEAALNARLTYKNRRGMDNAANLMRHILEAAAPHMLAASYDAGYNQACKDIIGMKPTSTPMPYRQSP